MAEKSDEEEAPYWIQAPEEVRAESFREMHQVSSAQESKVTKANWDEVNAHMIRWWKEKGFRFP